MQNVNEKMALLENKSTTNGLTTFFAIICIVDVFGVFPVVTLPKAVIDCGIYGFFVITLTCLTQIYTASLLGRCWVIAEKIEPSIKYKNRYPYAALTEISFGKKMASFVTFLLDFTIFGGGIPNLIVASQNLQLLGLRASGGSLNISFCLWIIIVGSVLCPVLWLGSPKDMKLLCSLSVGIVITVFLLINGCILLSTSEPRTEILENNSMPVWKNVLKAYGIIAFQFDIHPSILTIQVDMLAKSRLTVALLAGFSVSLAMFGTTTLIAYLKWGFLNHPSILEALPTTISLHVAAALVAMQLCLTSAVSNNALYQQMEDCMNISRDFNSKRCVLRTCLTVLAIVLAESVPRFDLVMSIIGGTFTGPLVFILPPLMFLKIRKLRKRHDEQFTSQEESEKSTASKHYKYVVKKLTDRTNVESIFCLWIVAISILLTSATSYINFNNAIYSYTNSSRPCIYNISTILINS